ncbi:hypothetical protein [Pontiella agarivorans]|uniref:DUF4412 domain-containing protein n=1 Tax=Pontiella agarivorans TaxID=3038953 RepID=A0ABU5MZ79_9BACT|nr:hypothetical protein [Pontiella agarivorans]MDZ8119477.1 hypothetical protein [Pontiella agarivorans]
MKWSKMTAVAVWAVAIGVQAQVEKPVVMEEAMLSVSIPGVHGFIDEVGLVASKASPMMNGAMLKSMLGMQLGDMSLAGIPSDGGLSIVALDPTNIFAVLEVSEAQSSAYLNMAKAKKLQAVYLDGAVVVAGDDGALKTGKSKLGAVKAELLAGNAPVLSLAMQPADVIERNREAVDGFMQMMPAMLGMSMMQQPGASLDSTQSITKLLQGELLVLLSLSEQCSDAEVRLAPENGSLVLSETFVPKAGTALAKAVNAPVVHQENPALHSGLLGEGAVRMDMVFSNPEALSEFISAEAVKTVKAMDLVDVDAAAVADIITKWVQIYAGTGCEAVSFGEDGFSVCYVMELTDENRTLEVLRGMNADMTPFLKMYESLGMPLSMAFKENVREADGLNIHEFGFEYDLSAMPEEQRVQMEAMGVQKMAFDLAITDGMLFYAEKGGVEKLVAAVKAGKTAPKIKARSVYPEGGFYYLDWDMGKYMAFVAESLPADPSTAMMKQQMSTLFKGTAPVTSAGFRKDGMVNWSLTIPGDLIAKCGQMIMMAQMQSLQQPQPGAPGFAPVVPGE